MVSVTRYSRSAIAKAPALSETAHSSGVQIVRGEISNMEKYLCLNITEAMGEVEGCKAYVVECQNAPVNRKQLSLAKAALRSAERELRDWQKGIVPPLVESVVAMGAAAGC